MVKVKKMSIRNIIDCILSNGCHNILTQNQFLKKNNTILKQKNMVLEEHVQELSETLSRKNTEILALEQSIRDYEEDQKDMQERLDWYQKKFSEYQDLLFHKTLEIIPEDVQPVIRKTFGTPAMITYHGRPKPTEPSVNFGMDVRLFITPRDALMRKELEKKGLTMEEYVKKHDDIFTAMDQLALDVYKWRLPKVKYQYDQQISSNPEYWKLPQETVADGRGDCFTGDTSIIVEKDGVITTRTFAELMNDWAEYKVLSYNFEEKKPEFKRITAFMERGLKPVFKVQARRGSFTCTDNHRFYCQNDQKAVDWKWKELKDIEIEKWYKRQALSLLQSPEGEKAISEDLANLIGAYVADGNTSHGKIIIAGDDPIIRRKLHESLDNLGIKYTQSKRKVHAYTSILKTGTPNEYLELFYQMGRKGTEKTFPPIVMQADNESIKRVLHYYSERDGTHKNGRLEVLSTVSSELAEQIKLLLLRLGVHYNSHVQVQNRQDCNRQPIHRIYVRNKPAETEYTYCEKNGIQSIEFVGVQETYDITVEDNHNFILAETKIIAHNCEDTTNEIISWMRNAGIPSYKVYNVCGWTRNGGGHSTVYYLDKENKFKHLETTIDYCEKKSMSEMPGKNSKDAGWIETPWFAFNDRQAYHQFTLSGLVKRKPWKIKIRRLRK